jgi:hypothetical protein
VTTRVSLFSDEIKLTAIWANDAALLDAYSYTIVAGILQ